MSASSREVVFNLDELAGPMPWLDELNRATARGLDSLRNGQAGDPFEEAVDVLETPVSEYFGYTEDETVAEYLTETSGNLLETYRQLAEPGDEVPRMLVDRMEGIYKALTDIEMEKKYHRPADV
jgi:hypothetical protein